MHIMCPQNIILIIASSSVASSLLVLPLSFCVSSFTSYAITYELYHYVTIFISLPVVTCIYRGLHSVAVVSQLPLPFKDIFSWGSGRWDFM